MKRQEYGQLSPTEVIEIHHVCSRWPLLAKPDMERLIESVAANGVREAVSLTQDGLLIDGQNRFAAAQAAGVPCPYLTVQIRDDDHAWEFCTDRNHQRRFATAGQKAIIAAEDPRYQPSRLKRLDNTSTGVIKDAPYVPQNSAAEAARIHGTSKRFVECARYLLAHAPDTADMVRYGELNIETAHAQAKRMAGQPAEPKRPSPAPKSNGSTRAKATAPQPPPPAPDKPPAPAPEDPNSDITRFKVDRERWAEIRRWYETICTTLDDQRKVIRAADIKLGYPIPKEHCEAKLTELIKTLRIGCKPYALCPYCQGQGHDPMGQDCQICSRQGWMSRAAYEQVPKDLKRMTPKEPA